MKWRKISGKRKNRKEEGKIKEKGGKRNEEKEKEGKRKKKEKKRVKDGKDTFIKEGRLEPIIK
jgi:hypothetical protein